MLRSRNRLGARARTVGVMVDILGDPYQVGVCEGIAEAVAPVGNNMVLFVGGPLPREPARGCQHRIYELAGQKCLDGILLLSSTLVHNVGVDGLTAFAKRYGSLPLASAGVALDGYPSVVVDNEVGMATLVHHLIHQHGARRLAFVSGPAANAESELRKAAYRTTLERHGIAYEEALVVEGNFMRECAAQAVAELEVRLGGDLRLVRAIVAANDNMGLGILDELDRRQIATPDEVAVGGFDDTAEAALAQPALTTVRQPMGRLGLETVRRLWSDERASSVKIPTELVVRQSCGCRPPNGDVSVPTAAGRQSLAVALLGQRGRIEAQLVRSSQGRMAALGTGWERSLVSCFLDDLLAGEPTRFLPNLQRMLSRLSQAGVGLSGAHDVLTTLRQGLIPLLLADAVRWGLAEDLLQAARSSVSAEVQRGLGRAALRLSRWSVTVAEVCNTLASCGDPTALQQALGQQLPRLGIRKAFVCLYRTTAEPRVAHLVAGYDARAPDRLLPRRPFDGRELLPLSDTPEAEGGALVLFPLVSQDEWRGHVLFEYRAEQAFTYNVLAEALGTALSGFRATLV